MMKYVITEEQLESIGHFKCMFELNANTIYNLCDSEKDDIVYGFELGKIHSHLRELFSEMMKLEEEICQQKLIHTKKLNPTQEATDFTNEALKLVDTLVSKDYKLGFKEGVEKYLIDLNNK